MGRNKSGYVKIGSRDPSTRKESTRLKTPFLQVTPPPPLSFPTPGKTVPHHLLGDGYQVTVPHPPLGDRTTTVHAHLQAQKLTAKPKAISIRCVQRAANALRPTP